MRRRFDRLARQRVARRTARGWLAVGSLARGPIALGALLLVLAACVPSARVSRTVAYDGTPIEASPGETLRVVVPFGYGAFRLEPGDLDPLPFPEIVFDPRENVTGSFVLRASDAPDGWTVGLDRVERVVTRYQDDEEGNAADAAAHAGRAYALDVALRVGVAGEAEPGTHAVTATLRARNTRESTVRLLVTVPR